MLSTDRLDMFDLFDDIFLPLPKNNGEVRRWVFIKKGFRTDCASIPRLARLFYTPTNPKWRGPAVGHDGLYSSELLPRAEADAALAYWMKLKGNNAVRRGLFYSAVRLGGGFVWRSHTRYSIAKARRFVSIIESPFDLAAHDAGKP